MRRLLVLPVIALTLVLGACGSSSGGAQLPEGATGSQPGSSCDQATFESTIHHIFTESDSTLTGIDSFTCSGEWALVQLQVSAGDGSVSDQEIFKRDGDAWILKAPETVCGTVAPGAARPADAEIPEDLWAQACTTN